MSKNPSFFLPSIVTTSKPALNVNFFLFSPGSDLIYQFIKVRLFINMSDAILLMKEISLKEKEEICTGWLKKGWFALVLEQFLYMYSPLKISG
ncbi:hypothetical protein A8O28_01105 [Enterobacteriaceae bacterium CCUG 67584]|nr:hypothetical protein [Enterobacteriaceae bacterium CCUG 67584]